MSALRKFALLFLLSLVAACGSGDESVLTANTLQRGIPTDPESLD